MLLVYVGFCMLYVVFLETGKYVCMPLGQLLLFDGSITLVEIGQNFLTSRKNLWLRSD